ncbi:MAG: hypothetical protein NW223_10525 [Hyphomicrobiaceae bacterium]|nr:hypothetical protein [Hyphomicrobiaceae bacterium]
MRSHSPSRIGAAVLLMCLVAAVHPAAPHTHADPDGRIVDWYPLECCHGRDCRPVAKIEEKRNLFWMTTTDGLTIAVDPNQPRRLSRDERWHVCIAADDSDQTVVRCVFEPARS